MLKQQKGITLLKLVFTIMAMLALAAVAIAMVLDELKYDPEPVQIETDKQIVSTDNANDEDQQTQEPVEDETPIAEVPQTTEESENIQ